MNDSELARALVTASLDHPARRDVTTWNLIHGLPDYQWGTIGALVGLAHVLLESYAEAIGEPITDVWRRIALYQAEGMTAE